MVLNRHFCHNLFQLPFRNRCEENKERGGRVHDFTNFGFHSQQVQDREKLPMGKLVLNAPIISELTKSSSI